MAAPTSPATAPIQTPKKKDESLLDKLGTLTRKKKGKEVSDLEEEGKLAIETPTTSINPDIGPEGYQLDDMEERSMVEKSSRNDPKVQELITILLNWINDTLADQRIIVKDIEEDLFDGQILQKLIEKLSGVKVQAPELSQTEYGQKQKLRAVMDVINNILQTPDTLSEQRWSVDSIHSKNLVAIMHLLVTLARAYKAPIRFPENVSVLVLVVQKKEDKLITRQVREEITGLNDDIGRFERDAFDALFDDRRENLPRVKQSLVTFVNQHLEKINMDVTDIDTQFHDGVFFILLLGLLEGYFVPLYSFYQTPTTFEQKVHNVSFSFELMLDAGIPEPHARPEDIVNLDLKSTLRVLYIIFKYKT